MEILDKTNEAYGKRRVYSSLLPRTHVHDDHMFELSRIYETRSDKDLKNVIKDEIPEKDYPEDEDLSDDKAYGKPKGHSLPPQTHVDDDHMFKVSRLHETRRKSDLKNINRDQIPEKDYPEDEDSTDDKAYGKQRGHLLPPQTHVDDDHMFKLSRFHETRRKNNLKNINRDEIPEKDYPEDEELSDDKGYGKPRGYPLPLQKHVDDDYILSRYPKDEDSSDDSSFEAEDQAMLTAGGQNLIYRRNRSYTFSITNCTNVSVASNRQSSGRNTTLEDLMERFNRYETENKERLDEINKPNIQYAMNDAVVYIKKYKKTGAFVNTKAFKNAKAKLMAYQLVVIIGNPGDGKSAIGIELLRYFSKDDNDIGEAKTPLIITTVSEFRAVQGFFKHAILFLDDFLYSRNHEQNLRNWEDLFDRFVVIAKYSSIMIIVSLDKHIYKEHNSLLEKYTLFSKTYRIDLSDDFALSSTEKDLILKSHLQRMNRNFDPTTISELASAHQNFGFPFCCALFAENDNYFQQQKKFFKHTIDCICKEVDSFKSHNTDKYKYWVLVSVFKLNGISEDIVNMKAHPNSKKIREITKLANKCDCDFSLKNFRNALLSMENSFIIFNSDTLKFQFCSKNIKNAVLIVYGRLYQEEVIQHVDSYTLYHYIKVTECEHKSFCLYLQRKHYPLLISRFRSEIKKRRISTVVTHVAWRTPEFYEVMYEMVKGKEILQIYGEDRMETHHSLLYWVLKEQPDNKEFINSLLEHFLSQRSESFCCNYFNTRERLFQREKNACVKIACELPDENVVARLVEDGWHIDRDIIQLCQTRHQYRILQILDPNGSFSRFHDVFL